MNVDQQEEQTAFESAFAQTSGQEDPAPAARAAEAQGADGDQAGGPAAQGQTSEEGAPAANATTQAEGAPAPQGQEGGQGQEDDPILLEGFKRSEVKRLLEQASKVGDLEQQLRKAQGKIGELNGKLQNPVPAQTTAPTPSAPVLPPELKQFEEDFPEIANYAKALFQAQQPNAQAAPPEQVQQTVATAASPAGAELDPVVLELAVMDRMHSGWRDKVQGQEFNLWLGAQSEDVQTAYLTADTADALAGVIGQFDQWQAAKAAQAHKQQKGKQRLAAAVTPQGNAPQPQAALTEDQAFEFGFNAIMGQR